MENFTVKKAAEKYRQGDYFGAYELYKIAAAQLGFKNFETNIKLCLKKINASTEKLKNEGNSYLNSVFDKVYLVNLKSHSSRRLKARAHLKEHRIHYDLVEAVNGYEGEALKRYSEYIKQPLGSLERYPEFNQMEIKRGKHFIESAGAVGYICTYLKVLQDAKANNYKKILILEDDIVFHPNFEVRLRRLFEQIGQGWKILQLGASQYNWNSVQINQAVSDEFYYPRRLDTCGSFAIALDNSVLDDLIEAESAFEAPFDHLPLGEIYEKNLGYCYVAYPNIVMPDVRESSIRGSRCQYQHGTRMKWPVSEFPFPLRRPTVAILVSSPINIKYMERFTAPSTQPFNANFYFNSVDGLRPIHANEVLNYRYNAIMPLDKAPTFPFCDFAATLEPNEVLSESCIINYIENQYDGGTRPTSLKQLVYSKIEPKKGRVSVVIPTYKRPANLDNALRSVAEQDYPDIEILVISDNGQNSQFTFETQSIIENVISDFPTMNISLIEHQENRNGAAARNTGILSATGQYICFLDDDDIYLQGRLSKSVAALEKANTQTGAVYCGFLGWNSPHDNKERYKEGNLTVEILTLDYKSHYLHTNTATYKRDAIAEINGFDETFQRHQDLEFNLRFLEHFDLGVVEHALVKLNPAPSSVSNKVYDENFIKIKCKFLDRFSEIIQQFETDVQRKIVEAHYKELKRYVNDIDRVNLYFDDAIHNHQLGIYRMFIQ